MGFCYSYGVVCAVDDIDRNPNIHPLFEATVADMHTHTYHIDRLYMY